MPAPAEPLLRHLRRLIARPCEAASSDAALLQRFVQKRDEDAFAALLARHGPMVYGVCRRALRDVQDAEDVFQATFLVLARKAGSLRQPETLSAWLHGTARRLALTSRRTAARRHLREGRCLEMVSPPSQTDPLDELSAREFLLVLDEEMARLPERYRLPLLLCGLQGRGQDEAARILGWTPGSLKGRLERGRKQLHARLTRRGLAFSAVVLALAVPQDGSSSAAARLTPATFEAALAFARGERGGTAAAVLTLAESGIASLTMTKAKVGLMLLLIMGLAAGAGALAFPPRSEKPSEAKDAKSPQPEATRRTATDRYGDPLPPGALRRLGTNRLRHGGHVMSVAFTPDGKSIVSGGFDGWAVQWDVRTGKRLRQFHQDAIQSVSIGPDGKRLALADWSSGTVKLFELATGKQLAECPGHRGGTWVVVFSPDGKRLASGGKDKRIRVWDAATLREVRSWQASRDELHQLRFTPDGKSLVSADITAQTLRFWDAATGAERPLREPLASLRVGCSCFSADGKTLLTGSNTAPGLLQLWDLATGKEIRTLARTQGGFVQVALAPDGKSVWTAALGDGLRCRELPTGKELFHLPDPFKAHESSMVMIHDLAVSPDGKRLAAGTQEHDVFLWDTTTGRRGPDLEGHRFLTTAGVFTPDGKYLWTGGFDGTIRCWSVDSGEQIHCFAREGDKLESVFSLALRRDGKMLAAAVVRKQRVAEEPDDAVSLWDTTTGEKLEPLHGHTRSVSAVAFSPDGRLLASRGEDHTIRLWDVATDKQLFVWRCQKTGAKGIAFSPDGRRVIGALDKETLGFWDVETRGLTRRLSVGASGGEHIPILSRDGRILITGGGEQPLRIWEVASGKERFRIERPNGKSYAAVNLSPDSRILAWFDYGQPIKLWDLIAGKPLGELGDRSNMADVLSLTFSPDSRRLASMHSDGTVLIWDVAKLLPKVGKEEMISATRLEELWSELGSADAAKAYRALRTLAMIPTQSIRLLRQRLPKSTRANTAKINRLLADLDSEQFETRERATRGLQALGMPAVPAMRRSLREQPSLEVRRRLEQILEKLESGERSADELRVLRAVEALELAATPEARRLLDELSQRSSEDWLAQEAKMARKRLDERSDAGPR
ncbi:MAG TPA: sigma-70 family RNA polymerase sigma factor [Gemmataceae bacterium]